MSEWDGMTAKQRARCIVLSKLMDEVKTYPGGADFVAGLLLEVLHHDAAIQSTAELLAELVVEGPIAGVLQRSYDAVGHMTGHLQQILRARLAAEHGGSTATGKPH